MVKDQSRLGIIQAIEKSSKAELEVLSRIEQSLTNSGPETQQPAQSSTSLTEVTVSAKRRSRGNRVPPPKPTTETPDKTIAQQVAKIVDPMRQKRAKSGREPVQFVAAASRAPVSKHLNAPASILNNERVFTQNAMDGLEHLKSRGTRVGNDPLTKGIGNLTNAIEKQTADVIRIDKNGKHRDANGRFLSKAKSDEIKSSQSKQVAEGTLQEGFVKRLFSAISDKDSGKGDDGTGDMAGTAAGGVLWHMARGAWDIGSSAKDNAVSLNDWRKKVFGSHESDQENENLTRGHAQSDVLENQTQGNLALKPAIAYPPVETLNSPQKPVDASKEIFEDNAKQAQVKATEKQTATLSAKDDVIIKNQEEELDLLKKIAHNGSANDGLEGFGKGLFKKLFGRNERKRRRERRNRIKEDRRSRKRTSGDGEEAKSRKSKTEKVEEREKVKGKTIGDVKPDPEKVKTTSKTTPEPEKGKVASKTSSVPEKGNVATTATKQGAQEAEKSAAKSTAKTVGSETLKDGGKLTMITEKASMAGSVGEAANDAVHGAEKIGGKTLAKDAAKIGGKLATKTALKTIPIVGTAAGTAWDAVDGYSDTEGQQKAFDLKEGQEATTRQKSEMAAANVAGLGGLIPLASQGASWLANKAGLTDKNDALDVETSDIAGGLDKGISAVGGAATSAYAAVKGLFSSNSDDKAAQSAQEKQVSDLKDAVKNGSDATVNAIDRLSKQLEGGKVGEDGVGAQGTAVSDYSAPTTNTITTSENGLNIGGKNAANRNFRNNNFGNLNFANQEGAVLENAPAKGKARFAKFSTPEDGFRALANQVSSYANGTSKAAGYQKLNTVQDIISKWAPPSENNTAQYIQTVSASLGVKPTDTIDTSDPKTMTKLMRAIATYEGGNPQVSDEFMMNSIGHEDAKTHKWVGGSYSKESQAYISQHGIKPSTAANVTATGAPVRDPATIHSISSPAESPMAPIAKSVTSLTQGNKIVGGTDPKAESKPSGILAKGVDYAAKSDAYLTSKLASTTTTASQLDAPATPSANINRMAQVASVMAEASSENWLDKGANYSEKADKYLTEKLQGLSTQHIGFRKPTSGLTLPKNATDIPESVRAAMGSPEQIAKANAPDLSVNQSGEAVQTTPTFPVQTSPIASPSNIAKEERSQPSSAGGSTLLSVVNKATPVTPQMQEAKALSPTNSTASAGKAPESEGFFGSIGHFLSGVGHSAMDAAPKALGSLSEAAIPAAQGMLSNFVGGMGGQLSSSIQSPILSALANPLIDKGVSAANNFIQSPKQVISDFSMPQVIPEVTNLAKSGAGTVMQKAANGMSGDISKTMQQLVDLTKQLLNVQKDKSDSQPDVVVHGGQKAPKRDDRFNDSALDKLMED